MKKLILSSIMAGALVFGANAQEFDKFSLEVGGGLNKPMAPITPGFFSPTLNLGHLEVGARYMFNEKFGIKVDYGFGSMKESDKSAGSFDTKYYRLNLQGVSNLGRIMNFESFSRSFGLLGHFGAGIGNVRPQENLYSGETDQVYNFIVGITPQLKLGKSIALVGDISTIINGRQFIKWDGNSTVGSANVYGANGNWWTGSLGLQFYLGKNEEHADWYIAADKYATKEELATQINGIKDMLKDSDGDGVPDYLDKEPNTPAGARVNSSGMTLDSDGDGTPDHLDKCPFLPGPASTDGCPVEEVQEQVDFFKKAINDGYVNVYYAFDSSKPLGYSTSAASYVSNFLKKNPGVSVEIKGYADELGPEDYNMKLSERRAKSVYDLLIASGVDASRLSYKGYGEDTSVDKSSADARQMARRASFEVK
ncbi:OOP family OmpA-OmpF porin [Algoriphagus sp. 4150]|uniref:OmpA family protein n=1 Tax=Algoriphagus sp. 4150 TaxID=2817756 RepID=UPI002863D30F|nr:OmpA family protein [Algoriphagus sp. 4150]MDR7131169.1 OOP family OmpA-OmpF porin [Algoriphagus sp. 4150]